MLSVAVQSDPKKLRQALEIEEERSKDLDVAGFDRLKRSLSRGSKIGVK